MSPFGGTVLQNSKRLLDNGLIEHDGDNEGVNSDSVRR